MSQLTIIANIHAKPDQILKVKAALLKLVPIIRAEEGCLTYTPHQNNENPAPFTRTGSRVSCGSSTCRHRIWKSTWQRQKARSLSSPCKR